MHPSPTPEGTTPAARRVNYSCHWLLAVSHQCPGSNHFQIWKVFCLLHKRKCLISFYIKNRIREKVQYKLKDLSHFLQQMNVVHVQKVENYMYNITIIITFFIGGKSRYLSLFKHGLESNMWESYRLPGALWYIILHYPQKHDQLIG